jgi:hypothetical protein
VKKEAAKAHEAAAVIRRASGKARTRLDSACKKKSIAINE